MTEITPCDKLTLALVISALACCSNSFADIENSNAKTGDEAPPAVKRLVTGGWRANPERNIRLSQAEIMHLALTQSSIPSLQNANVQSGSFQEAPISTP